MNTFFVILMVVSFVLTLLSDRKLLKKSSKSGKVVYGVLASLVLLELFSGVFDFDIMYPTEWIIYQVAPVVKDIVTKMQ